MEYHNHAYSVCIDQSSEAPKPWKAKDVIKETEEKMQDMMHISSSFVQMEIIYVGIIRRHGHWFISVSTFSPTLCKFFLNSYQ